MDATASVPLVYVLDDDASVRRSLEWLIRSVGLEVRSFSSAAEFLDCGACDEASCLVVDVRMPGLSGLDLQEWLAAAGCNIPIVFITGHGNVPMSVRAMRGGAVDFLQKPFEDQQILDSIRQAIERETRARRERSLRHEIERRFRTLTPREGEVFSLVVSGWPNKRIAGKLDTSEKTVKVHRARVMAKMRAASLAELVRMAHESALIPGALERDDVLTVGATDSTISMGPRSNFPLLGASKVFAEGATGSARDPQGDERWSRSRAGRQSPSR